MWTPRLKSCAQYVRRLVKDGWSAVAAARRYGITAADVHWILDHPPRPPVNRGQARMIRGRLGPVVVRRILDGQSPDAIASELDLAEPAIVDWVIRLTPRQGHKRRRGKILNRARSAREQAALSDWLRFYAPSTFTTRPAPSADVVPAIAAAEPASAVEPATWSGPTSPNSVRFPGRRGPARKSRRGRCKSDADRRVKLTRADRDEIRRLARDEGWGVQRIAQKFGVARSTVQNILSGKGFSGDRAKPVPPRPLPVPIGLRTPDPAAETQPKRTRRGNADPARAVLTPELRAEARRLAREGLGYRAIAARLGVKPTAIRRLLEGATYFDDPDAAVPRPKPARWTEPAGTDRRRRGDYVGQTRGMATSSHEDASE